MATYSSWTVSGASIDYVPIENPVNETVKLFNGKEQGSVPPTTNLSSNTGQYILAQDGTWIPQPSFTSGGSDAFEILRPSVLTPTYSAYTPTVTNSANAYDVDTNHATTFGEWECAFVSRNLPITDTLLFTSFGSKTQTWTSATINISRAYGYFNDGESNSSSKVTSVKVEFSTNGGSSWTTIVTDLSTAVPLTATTSSYTFTTTPTMGNVQVKLTLVRGGGGMIYDPEIGISVPGSTGDIDLRLYDIWISGTYSGGSGNITCNNLTVTGDATFQNKIYDSTASAGTTGQVLKVASNGKVTWATDSAGTGTVTSITTTGANGVTISGGSTQTITTSGTFALALGNITPTSISTGTGSFSGDVEFAASIKSPNGSNSPIVISPDGTGDLHVNADSLRLGDNNADATIATNGTGDLILTTHEYSATEGVIRLYDGANGNITLTPHGTGQVQVGSDQVVTLTASQTLTNKSLSGSSNTFTNIPNSATTATSANTASAIVARDALGNFSAGTITATLSGNATNVTGTVAVANGGTGLTTLTAGYIPYGNGTSAFGSSANLFWDSTNSRLGVGTSSPSTKLEVNGAALINGSSGFLRVAVTGTPTSGTAAIQVSVNSVNARTIRMENTASGGHTYDIINGSAGVAGNIGIYDDTAGAYRWVIDSSGNVGIGSSAPNNYAGFKTLTINGTSGAEIDFTTAGSLIGYIFNDSNNLYLGGNTGKSAVFLANASEGMRLNSTGLGIGTASPSTKLHVSNAGVSAQATFVGTTGSPYITVVGNSGTTILGNESNGGWVGTVGSQSFVFKTTDTERMRIDSSGNLGLGVTPSAWGSGWTALQLKNGSWFSHPSVSVNYILGNAYFDGNNYKYYANGYATEYYFGGYNGAHVWSTASSGNAGNSVTLNERMRITSGGDVGIGTSSPSEKLNVSGKIKASDVLLGNNGTKGYGAITTTTSTSTPTGGSSGDHYYIY